MATAEAPAAISRSGGGLARRWAWPGLAIVLAAGLGLRLWGVQQGLPYAYNADENDHFVPHAVQMFEHGTLNPGYFANPPAFTYLLHFLYGLWYGGGAAVVHAYFADPTGLFTLARVAAALLGTLALWLLYLAGARLFGRGVGLLAAAIEAVAFLPVFYAHLALNDVPTLAPLTLSLLGTAGVLRKGRLRDHLLAGIGLGLACASKYTAGIVLLPYAAAAVSSYLDARAAGRRGAAAGALTGALVMGAAALCAFVIANPYALLDFAQFRRELAHQSSLSAEAQGKLGAPRQGGFLYYLWALTWGLGWVPALAALGGAVAVWWHDRRAGWVLVPGPLLFLAFMGTEGRYFGRWLMPILPVLCLLGAAFAVWVAQALARGLERRGAGPGEPRADGGGRAWGLAPMLLVALLAAALLAQGLIYSVHSGLVLSRADTRTLTRNWMRAHLPAAANVVVEPVSPDQWARAPAGSGAACRGSGPGAATYLWCKWPSEYSYLGPGGTLDVAGKHKLGIEDYERTLAPALIGYYEQRGYCWVVTGSTESGRASADPKAVPLAIAYYRALAERGTVVFRASPYAKGQGPVPFNFDWSFDYYPLAYHRPGPVMTVYRLHGGRCR